MDDMLRARAQKLKARREAVLLEMAGVRRSKEMPAVMLTAAQIDAFDSALRSRPQDGIGGVPKRYLRQFVSGIRL